MLTIEEIKKACEFADGFDVKGNMLVCGSESFHSIDFPKGLEIIPEFVNVYYPLFLQRVIEGINKTLAYNPKGMFISQDGDGLEVCRWRGKDVAYFSFDCFDTPDEAKEQAIKYTLRKL